MNISSISRAILVHMRDAAASAIENFFAALLAFLAIGGLCIGIRWVAEWLDRHGFTILAAIFVAMFGITLFIVLRRTKPEDLRNAQGKIVAGFVVGLVVAIGFLWVYAFGLFSFFLMKLDLIEFTFKPEMKDPLSDLFDTYLWYFLELLPGRFNDAFQWGPDVKLANYWQGALLMLFRALILFQLLALAGRIFAARRAPAVPRAAAPTAQAASGSV